jgi:hypothetical protein
MTRRDWFVIGLSVLPTLLVIGGYLIATCR